MGTLRPSRPKALEIFRQHFIVAPYRKRTSAMVDEIGIDPIVFGSDFPHGEGLAFPDQYVDAQLTSFTAEQQRKIMRDNLENFLNLVPNPARLRGTAGSTTFRQ